MVTWSARHAGDTAHLSEYFVSGTAPTEDAANFAALSFVGGLVADVPGDTLYCVTIGTKAYTVTVEEARDTVLEGVRNVLRIYDAMESLRQLLDSAEL